MYIWEKPKHLYFGMERGGGGRLLVNYLQMTWLIYWNSYAVFGLEGVFLHPLGRSSKCGSPKQSKFGLTF